VEFHVHDVRNRSLKVVVVQEEKVMVVPLTTVSAGGGATLKPDAVTLEMAELI